MTTRREFLGACGLAGFGGLSTTTQAKSPSTSKTKSSDWLGWMGYHGEYPIDREYRFYSIEVVQVPERNGDVAKLRLYCPHNLNSITRSAAKGRLPGSRAGFCFYTRTRNRSAREWIDLVEYANKGVLAHLTGDPLPSRDDCGLFPRSFAVSINYAGWHYTAIRSRMFSNDHYECCSATDLFLKFLVLGSEGRVDASMNVLPEKLDRQLISGDISFI